MRLILILLTSTIFQVLLSCQKRNGCTDNVALNHDYEAEEDDGSCNYSSLTFYQTWSRDGKDTVSRVEVKVNGEFIGNCTYAFGDDIPHNCYADGTVLYKLTDGEKVYWNTRTYFTDGKYLPWEGEVIANSKLDCIKIAAQPK